MDVFPLTGISVIVNGENTARASLVLTLYIISSLTGDCLKARLIFQQISVIIQRALLQENLLIDTVERE